MKTNYVCLFNSNVCHAINEYPDHMYNTKTDEELINNISFIPEYNYVCKPCINYCGIQDLTYELPIIN